MSISIKLSVAEHPDNKKMVDFRSCKLAIVRYVSMRCACQYKVRHPIGFNMDLN